MELRWALKYPSLGRKRQTPSRATVFWSEMSLHVSMILAREGVWRLRPTDGCFNARSHRFNARSNPQLWLNTIPRAGNSNAKNRNACALRFEFVLQMGP